MKKILLLLAFLAILSPIFVPHKTWAKEVGVNESIYRAQVIDVLTEKKEVVYGGQEIVIQDIKIEILNSDKKGTVLEIKNDTFPLSDGDVFYLMESYDEFSGMTYYYVNQIDRSPMILGLLLLFLIVVVIFAGKQGVRSILGLIGSFLVIIFVLLPGLTKFDSPIFLSILVSLAILFFAVVITHGWNRTSLVALLGLTTTMIVTALLAHFSIELGGLTGYVSEEAVYLNFNTGGTVNLKGILLGGIIIGVIGVLDDIAITQVSIVKQLWQSNPSLSKNEVFKRAITVGKDHTSSLVNTLVLAYTGVSLPVLLLFRNYSIPFLYTVNTEQIASEIVRTIAGSIGIILCVPITTYLAVLMYQKDKATHDHSEGHVCAHCK